MRTSLSSFPGGSVLPSLTTATSGTASVPPQAESSDSFSDVLQQQEGGSPKVPGAKGNSSSNAPTASTQVTPSSATSAIIDSGTAAETSDPLDPSQVSEPVAIPSLVTPPAPAPAAPAKSEPASNSSTVPSGSALSAMLVQASIVATSTQKAAGPITPSNATPVNPSDLSTLLAQASAQASSAQKSAGPIAPSNSTPVNSPDLSTLFAQVSAQTASTQPSTPTSTPSPAKTPAGSAKNASSGTSAAKTSTQFNSGAPDLQTVIAQATILASNALQTAASSPALTSTRTTPNSAAKDFSSGSTSANNPASFLSNPTDLQTVIAQATILASNALQTGASTSAPTSTPAPSSAPAVPIRAAKDSSSGSTSVDNLAPFLSSPKDLQTAIAQATSLASNAQPSSMAATGTSSAALSSIIAVSSGTGLGKELPLSGLSTTSTGSQTKEKKSASSTGEGSFLQPGTSSSSTSSSLGSTSGSMLSGINELIAGQQVTPVAQSNNLTTTSLSSAALSAAGTANVEKGKAMNADSNFPELEILSGYGVNAPAQQNAPDMNILLSSNNDFHDALKQVMHVADLTQTSQSVTPMRVEMEIQTPPGAIVNVYVSKQNDQLRAQLSTNDPVALAWVQNQMSSLRQSNDIGVSVRWLPPQMESGTFATSTSSGSQDSNLGWDRGGQGQSNYQQQEERSRPRRENESETLPELAGVGASPFLSNLTALGRAA